MILSFWNHQAIMLVWGSVFFFDTLKYHKFHETRPPWKMLLFVPQFSGNFSDIFGPSYLRPRILGKFVIAETPKPMTGGGFSGLFYQKIIEKIFDLEQQKLLQLQKLQYFWWQSEAFCKGRRKNPGQVPMKLPFLGWQSGWFASSPAIKSSSHSLSRPTPLGKGEEGTSESSQVKICSKTRNQMGCEEEILK